MKLTIIIIIKLNHPPSLLPAPSTRAQENDNKALRFDVDLSKRVWLAVVSVEH